MASWGDAMTWSLTQPGTLEDALAVLAERDPGTRVIAGGTSLLLRIKAHEIRPEHLVSLHRLRRELSTIVLAGTDADAGEQPPQAATTSALEIGAMATHTMLERSALVREHVPVVGAVFRLIANIRVRNVATIGGNLGHGDPHMDLPPILLALDARVCAASRARGERWIGMGDLATGAFTTSLQADELITRVLVPFQPDCAAYAKCTALSAGHDWPGVGVAVAHDLVDGTLRDPVVAVGGAEARPRRLTEVEDLLADRPLTAQIVNDAKELAAETVDPITDNRGSGPFKRELVRAYVGRALETAHASPRAGVTL